MRIAASCVALLLATTACAGDSDGGEPADAVLSSAAQLEAELNNTQTRLRELCMTRKGFTVHPLTGRAKPRMITPPQPLLASVEVAREQGYQPTSPPDQAPPPADPFSRLPQAEQDRYHEAMSGPRVETTAVPGANGTVHMKTKDEDEFVLPDGTRVYRPRQGCEGEVSRAVLVDFPRYAWLERVALYGLQDEVHRNAMNAPEPRTARAEWESCMAGKGYPGMTESETARRKAKSFYLSGTPATARNQEIELAVAHATCDSETGFEATKLEAWQREYVRYVETHETDLVAWHEYVRDALARAQRMLSA